MRVSGAVLVLLGGVSAMHMKPPLSQAVCDNPSFLIEPESGWCYKPGVKVRSPVL